MIGAVLGSVAIVVLILARILVSVVYGVIRAQNRSRNVYVSNKDAGIRQPAYDHIDLPEFKDDNDQRGVDRRYNGPPNLKSTGTMGMITMRSKMMLMRSGTPERGMMIPLSITI